ncbi:MAG TPA: RagB/SusD family nutrient uptake outer membrane protein [Gemmatimonadales bacterium]|nr:RagB/SusD family nutrient uptake outer membrane protein [Gemmatimonadales bacterium]
MKRTFVASSIGAVGLCALLLVPVQACTNLDESPPSAISPGNFFRTEGEVLAALAGVYAQLRGTLDDYYNLSEISTDEMIVPTRGQDWYDNGTWLETHRQIWTASSPATLSFMNGAWNTAYAGVARANALLDGVANVSVANQATMVAEARTLRAFYYYILMDLFGGVPLATTSGIAERPRVSRDSLFRFIEAELLAARADLADSWTSGNHGRLTKGAADAMLANLYINAGVFTKDAAGGTGINATGYNSCSGITVTGGVSACQAAIDRVDAILNGPTYDLAPTFAENFNAGNFASPENIFVVKFAPQSGLGLNFVMRALHYNQFTPTPWNGFAAVANAYNAFDAADARRAVFLVGPQVNVETGVPVNDRSGQPLVFTPGIANITAATEGEGARVYKWPADPAHVAQDNGNDFAWFRVGEMFLIKAEALNEQAPGSAAALALVNQLRARAFNPDVDRATIDRAAILQERLFEFIGEGKRRQDLIRFGQYTAPSQYKPTASPDFRVLMPIPQGQIDANPQMTQNSGY